MLKTSTRTLLTSGKEVISPQAKASLLFQNSQDREATLPVYPCRDADLYKFYKGIDLTAGIDLSVDDAQIAPVYTVTQEQIDGMRLHILSTRRDDTAAGLHDPRIELEWGWFTRAGALPFLYNAWKLIERFKQDGVVWGVGRGSSCASYVLYLLEIHDINPIRYSIEFAEFSKEYK